MSLQVHFERRALRDIQDAFDWSEARHSGFGRRVENAILKFIESLTADPKLYPIYCENVRQAYLRKYRYLIFFMSDEEKLTILAIRHSSRSLEDLDDRFPN